MFPLSFLFFYQPLRALQLGCRLHPDSLIVAFPPDVLKPQLHQTCASRLPRDSALLVLIAHLYVQLI